ncbi:hypothetical protein DB346_19360 [Verrucomicrobia bacterium LW23]|nr:hypothetical protein DB346_19360 [Verrucomicrobia bacterium LW23]
MAPVAVAEVPGIRQNHFTNQNTMKLTHRYSYSPFRVQTSPFQRDIERLFDFAFPSVPLFGESSAADSDFGAVDAYRDAGKLVVRTELPGVARDAISVDVIEDQLILSVNAVDEATATEATTVSTNGAEPAQEPSASPKARKLLSRSFSLPDDVDWQKVTARYENGVLTVEVPKREEAQPRTINVEVA